MFRVLAISLVSLTLRAPPAAAQTQTVHVRAWIDGRSRLVVDGPTARWQHFEFAAPGRLECDLGSLIQPTYLDGVPWFPNWPDVSTCENRDCHCGSDVYSGITPPLPDAEFSVAIVAQACRGGCSIVELPSAANGFALTIELDDNPLNGADWYEFDVVATSLGCGALVRYCASTSNSTGWPARLELHGSLDLTHNDAHLRALNCPPSHAGMFFYGALATELPFCDGYLCVRA